MGASSSAPASQMKGWCLDDQCCAERKSKTRVLRIIPSDSKTYVKRGLTPISISKSENISADETSNSPKHSPTNFAIVPSWRRSPAPMKDWTAGEQQVLIDQLETNPQAWRHHAHRERVFEKTHRLLPEKTMEQIEQCYQHLQSKRIAYFGKSDIKEGTNALPPRGPSRRSFDDFPNIGDPQRSSKDVRHSLS